MTTTHFHRLYAYFDKISLSLTNHQGQLSFVRQNELSYGITYENSSVKQAKSPLETIYMIGLGACIWVSFPKSKAMLNFHHLKHPNDDNTDNKRN